MNKRTVGSKYEQIAGDYLCKNGYRILKYNYRCKRAELDLIAFDGSYLVFVEVKYRSSRRGGTGAEAVDKRKQARIRTAALYYMTSHKIAPSVPVRFDVVWIEYDRIHLIKNAFDFS